MENLSKSSKIFEVTTQKQTNSISQGLKLKVECLESRLVLLCRPDQPQTLEPVWSHMQLPQSVIVLKPGLLPVTFRKVGVSVWRSSKCCQHLSSEVCWRWGGQRRCPSQKGKKTQTCPETVSAHSSRVVGPTGSCSGQAGWMFSNLSGTWSSRGSAKKNARWWEGSSQSGYQFCGVSKYFIWQYWSGLKH